ncbi:MAG: LysM peptidoglycan-binding domain-containing protein [Candidatus Riflebacteria bacterium]|nr:LysM peptidoglycan-binding domain-containing protein [Candidatus Riflebacteria bacterium]
MWNNLRARHYSVLILLAIVALETSAIAIDRFINRESETAFTIESPFQNNPFIQNFRMADASCAVLPVKFSSRSSTPAVTAEKPAVAPAAPVKTISAEFIAAAGRNDNYKKFVEYSVQPGDSLSNIAMLFGSETEAIKRYNKIDDRHSIMAGQTIKVPMPTSDLFYTVRKGDSLTKIASRFRIQLKDIVESNNLKSHMLVADQRIKIPVVDNKADVAIVRPAASAIEITKKLELVRDNKVNMVGEQKLEMVKIEKVQAAVAPAVKPKIEFIEKELLAQPPVVAKSPAAAQPVARLAASKITALPVPQKIVPVVAPIASPAVEKAEENREVSDTVNKGDSLLKIAMRFNTTVAQLQSDNNIKGTFLKVGQELKVNPDKKLFRVVKATETAPVKTAETSNVNHKVKSGESLSLIARKYRTTISSIVAANELKNTVLMAGQTIKVPTAKGSDKSSGNEVKDYKVVQGRSAITRASWKMPVRGRLSDKYGWRNHPVYRKRLFHAGIDIAAPKGSPIASSASGKVIYAGRRPGYGNLVILSHAGGYSTRYAHCSSILVKKGQSVKAGQVIARVGATGVATGNHLHFELRKNGKTQNPLTFLR